MTSKPQTQQEKTGGPSCDLPRRKFIDTVLVVCREASRANRPEAASEQGLAPYDPEEIPDPAERERAVGVAERMGLVEGEAAELIDALRDLGATSGVDDLLARIHDSNLEKESILELEVLIRNRPPSAEETMLALRNAYSQAYHQWERHRGERGWALYSSLIPGLINPILALGTPIALFAAVKLVVDLSLIFGRSVDGYEASMWLRILDISTVGASPALRALATELRDISPLEVENFLLEPPADPTKTDGLPGAPASSD
jgi:hypothetical protein